ncbi:uncharacterized protein LOC126902175 [Daktulosphaira vitifoliae]|uniref:uncharacterized protein LOC126902175 n=1 Tax=Daktulosphaira vitifoliae TaxID=58002 RepID=UPI0021AAE4D1|nr:uncharacterized protein LOC126902175 [Daktulosphaira vitifoliae]
MVNIITRIIRIGKKKLGLRKKRKVISVDYGTQTNKLTDDINGQIKSVPEAHILESQNKEVQDIAVQTSLLTSEKLTQTNIKLMFNVSETQTELSLLNSLNCETQTDVSLENIISNKKSLHERHDSMSILKNYMHTGSQCCLIPTTNEPILDTIKELSLKGTFNLQEVINPSTTLNDAQEKTEPYVTKKHITTEGKFEQISNRNITLVDEIIEHDLKSCISFPLEASKEVDAVYDWSNAVEDFNKTYLNEGVVNKQNGSQVDNGLQFYTLDNVPQLQLRNNYDYSMRVLYCQADFFRMTRVKNEQIIRTMENIMNVYYKHTQDCNFKPRRDELCAVKYSDGNWYRGVCTGVENSVDGSQFYNINLIDWGETISVIS